MYILHMYGRMVCMNFFNYFSKFEKDKISWRPSGRSKQILGKIEGKKKTEELKVIDLNVLKIFSPLVIVALVSLKV